MSATLAGLAQNELRTHSHELEQGGLMKFAMQVRRIFQDSVLMYFAPLVGAIKGIRAEYMRADRAVERNHREESACK